MKKLLSLMFVVLLLLPATVHFSGVDLNFDVERSGFEPPPLLGKALLKREFYRAWDRYFNDSFPLQGPLILAKRRLEYYLFRTTDADEVHIGTNGWLYHRQSVEDYRGSACGARLIIARTVLKLHALEKMIEASGRNFLFMVVPNKSTIYPEYIGAVPRDESCRQSAYDVFLKAMAAHPLKGFVRLDQRMNAMKMQNDSLLYNKDSRFWNDTGAALAVDELFRKFGKHDWTPPPVVVSAAGRKLPGDLSMKLMKRSLTWKEARYRRLTGTGKPELPSGILYGDEFVEQLLPNLSRMFRRLDVVQADRIPSVHYGETLHSCEAVVIEVTESALKSLRIDLEDVFSMLKIKPGGMQIYPLNPTAVRAAARTTLRTGGTGVEIKSAGSGATMTVDDLPGSTEDVFRIAKFAVSTHHPARWIVDYGARVPYQFTKALPSGVSEFLLPLPFEESVSLHIQLGKRPGLFAIESIEIIDLPKESKALQTDHDALAAKTAAAKPERVASMPDPGRKMPKLVFEAERERESNPLRDVWLTFSLPVVELEKFASGHDRRIAVSDSQVASTTAEKSTTIKEDGMMAAKPASETDRPIEQMNEKSGAAGALKPESASAARRAEDEPASIHLADYVDGRIFQRIGSSTDVTVSGSFSGNPGAIEGRVVRHGSQEEVLPWTIIDPDPQDGLFLGILRNVPQGGWYRLQVRSAIDHAAIGDGRNRWGVGMLIACIGQSNMKEWFRTGKDHAAHPLLQKYSSAGWEPFEQKGNGAIAFGNRIVERLGIPVGLMDFAVDGTGLKKEADWGAGYWQDTSSGSIYQRLINGIAEAGGAVEYVIWSQGEADAARGTVTQKEYLYSLEGFVTHQIRADVRNGSAQKHLPFLIVMMSKRPYGKDAPHQAIRNAQKKVAEKTVDCYLAATTMDLKNLGKEHLTPDAYTKLGLRVAQTVFYVLGLENYHRGPAVEKVQMVDTQTIDVRIKHRGGSDLTPSLGATGWQVQVGEDLVPIERVAKQDSRTLRIYLKQALSETAQIRYLYGAMPDVRRPILDNTALRLPLEAFQGAVNSTLSHEGPGKK